MKEFTNFIPLISFYIPRDNIRVKYVEYCYHVLFTSRRNVFQRLYSLGQACQTTFRFTVRDWLSWFYLTYLFRIISGLNSNGTEIEPLLESFSGRGCIHAEVKWKAILYCGQY